ncbi:MAG: signal recognition particle-docking protein FtsY [Acidobacteria bacterium]|nr:signal recognition particle-docking protein FtsY [Acidobacteriota bacterium]
MDNAPLILLLLVGIVVVFGLGVVVLNRRKVDVPTAVEAPPAPPIAKPPSVDEVPRVEEPTVAEEADEFEVVEEEETGPEPEPPVEPEVVAPKRRFAKAAGIFTGAFAGVRAKEKITADTWDDLEETLLRADVGLSVTTSLLAGLKSRVDKKEITDPRGLVDALQAEMTGQLSANARALTFDASVKQPNIWLFVGVNGVGKTTTIGKVAFAQKANGRNVLLAAGDTFRAAAGEQLETWAGRAEVPIVRGSEGGDPSAVIFDAVQSAAARGCDLVLADTAGRLQNKTNLMEELKKVRRVAEKDAGTVTEVLLVIDATTGQNGLSQAAQFAEATNVTGVVLTKLDGSAKGGIVFAIETQLGIPVKLVGLGETIADLVAFDPDEYIHELFDAGS